MAELVTGHRDDAAPFGQRSVAERLEQRRHELAPGQVAGAAKQDKVKTHGVSVSVHLCDRVWLEIVITLHRFV
ncbi:hypothetical protein D3C71_2217270 [compost metagenome]